MANLVDQITIGDQVIAVVDSDPSAGGGFVAEVGSIALDNTTGSFYTKTGATATDWAAATTSATIDEQAQDAVGNILTDTATIDFTYDDGTPQITADLKNTTVVAGSYGAADTVPTYTVDAQGRLTAAADAAIAITSTAVTDFNEAAQDAVGNILTDSASIDFTYDDGANTITATVIPGGVDHGGLAGLLDDDHTQYALLAGRTGGQTLNGSDTASENLTLDSTANATKGSILIGTYAAFDQANSEFGLGTQTPEAAMHLRENTVDYLISGETAQTVGAVTATAVVISTASDTNGLVKIFAVGNDGSGNQVCYERTVCYKNVAGTVTLGKTQSDYTDEDNAIKAANVAFQVTGTNVEVLVTGAAGATIDWKISARVVK